MLSAKKKRRKSGTDKLSADTTFTTCNTAIIDQFDVNYSSYLKNKT